MSQINPFHLFPFRFLISHLILTLYLPLDLPSLLLTQVILKIKKYIYALLFFQSQDFLLSYACYIEISSLFIWLSLPYIILLSKEYTTFLMLWNYTPKHQYWKWLFLILSEPCKLKSHNILFLVYILLSQFILQVINSPFICFCSFFPSFLDFRFGSKPTVCLSIILRFKRLFTITK